MTRAVTIALGCTVLLAAVAVGAGGAVAAPAADGEFAVAGVGTNNQIAAGPDGNMWVTLDAAGKDLARITPAGVVTEFDVADIASPVGIAAGADGRMWITQAAAVVSFDVADPVGSAVKTPVADIADPRAITRGPDDNLWTASADKVVKIVPGPPVTTQTFVGTGLVGARWIANGGATGLWIADFGGQAVLNLQTDGTKTMYVTGGGPQGVAFGAGIAAYSDPGTNPQTVGRITPGGSPQTTAAPGSDPFGVAYGSDGAFWFAQFATNDVGRLSPDGTYSTLALSAASGPRQIASGPANTVWVTLDTAEKVARVSGVEPPPAPTPTVPPTPATTPTTPPTPAPSPPAPDTAITKGPKKKVGTSTRRATVRFRFTSSDPAASFQCRVRAGAAFRACATPKAYRLGPGRYTFRVRAVAGGLADASPAVRTFRVVRR